MPASVFHQKSEFLALRTLTSSSRRQSGKLLSSLNEECFFTTAGKEAFLRIKKHAKRKAEIMSWDDLVADPTLTDNTRSKLVVFKRKPVTSRRRSQELVERLHRYRQIRAMAYLGQHISKTLKKSSVDPEELITTAVDYVTKARSSTNTDKWFTNIGAKDKASAADLLKRTLNVDDKSYIPTGYRSFDSRSYGIPRGTFMLIGTMTGGGKSVMCGQLAEQMAEQGSRVCLVTLEMSDIENQQRLLARQCDMSMKEILIAKTLPNKTKKRIKARFFEFHDKVRRNGGLLSYFIPDEDLSMEELLLTLKPYEYDAIIIDYIGLLKGVDGDDQWRALGKATRFAKRFAVSTQTAVIAAVQMNEENKIKYSRTMAEHANLAWTWVWNETIRESGIIAIEQPKSRNQASFLFYLKHDFEKMRFISLTPKEERNLIDEQRRATNDNKPGERERDKGKGAKEPEKDFKKVRKEEKLSFFAGF
jgi:replicative DNA helicase